MLIAYVPTSTLRNSKLNFGNLHFIPRQEYKVTKLLTNTKFLWKIFMSYLSGERMMLSTVRRSENNFQEAILDFHNLGLGIRFRLSACWQGPVLLNHPSPTVFPDKVFYHRLILNSQYSQENPIISNPQVLGLQLFATMPSLCWVWNLAIRF